MANNSSSNWLLLRGLTRESEHWGAFKEQLAYAFPGSRIDTLDLPGTGVFYKDKSPNNIPEITDIVRKHARQEGLLKSSVNLLGVSMGGMIALEWMQMWPNEINAGVLLNASFAGMNPFYQRLRWQCYLQLFRAILHKDLYKRELAIIKLITNRTERYDDLARAWHEIQQRQPVSPKNALAQLIAAARYSPDEKKPEMPILLLNSLGDRLVSPNCTIAIGKRWGIPYKTHKTAGHDLTTDEAEWVIEQVVNFIKSTV